MASKISKITEVLKGTAYIPQDGLADYGAARNVMNALRRHQPNHQLMGVREALRRHRVTAWWTDDHRLILKHEGKEVLEL